MKFKNYKHITEVIEHIIENGYDKADEDIKRLQLVRRNILEAILESDDKKEFKKLQKYNKKFFNNL